MKKLSGSNKVRPRKSLGQNFLIDPHIKNRILAECALNSNDVVLEIGPGLGGLTFDLSRTVRQVHAVEKDKNLIALLNEHVNQAGSHSNITTYHADFLKFPLSQLPKITKIIGNLPYNISTPIVLKVIEHRHLFSEFFFTVQSEFGKRLAAKVNSKAYGSLSCYVQYYSDIKILFKIKNSAFRPIPKVASCFMHLTFRTPRILCLREKYLFYVIRLAFQQRRKMLINSLSVEIPKGELCDALRHLNIQTKARAENLTLRNYIDLVNVMIENYGKGQD